MITTTFGATFIFETNYTVCFLTNSNRVSPPFKSKNYVHMHIMPDVKWVFFHTAPSPQAEGKPLPRPALATEKADRYNHGKHHDKLVPLPSLLYLSSHTENGALSCLSNHLTMSLLPHLHLRLITSHTLPYCCSCLHVCLHFQCSTPHLTPASIATRAVWLASDLIYGSLSFHPVFAPLHSFSLTCVTIYPI